MMQKIGDILKRFDPNSGKYISREFQAYGLYIAEKLGDEKHKTLYIKLSKTTPRYLLEQALTFTMETKAKNRGAMFMWKLKELKSGKKPTPFIRSNKQDERKINNMKLDI